jgi:hypothetical protein
VTIKHILHKKYAALDIENTQYILAANHNNNRNQPSTRWLAPVILATWKTVILRIAIRGQPQKKKKYVIPYLSGKNAGYRGAPVIPAMVGTLKLGRSQSRPVWVKSKSLFLK